MSLLHTQHWNDVQHVISVQELLMVTIIGRAGTVQTNASTLQF